MTSPIWVPLAAVIAIHDRQISRHGGAAGMRGRSLLEAGCARPLNQAAYGTPSLPELAAAYAYGIAKAHAFVDGNKRAAFLAVGLFLALNGYGLKATQADATLTMFAVAAGQLDEPTFATWLREHAAKR